MQSDKRLALLPFVLETTLAFLVMTLFLFENHPKPIILKYSFLAAFTKTNQYPHFFFPDRIFFFPPTCTLALDLLVPFPFSHFPLSPLFQPHEWPRQASKSVTFGC